MGPCSRAVARGRARPCGNLPGLRRGRHRRHTRTSIGSRELEDKHDLSIKQIRDFCLDLGLKPAAGRRKVAIVDDADDLNDEAANAFLKTLEEPPPSSVLILVGTSPESQLDTIVSRCRVLGSTRCPRPS